MIGFQRVLNEVQVVGSWLRQRTLLLAPLLVLPLFLAAGLMHAGRSDTTTVIVVAAPALFYACYAASMVKRLEEALKVRQAHLESEVRRRMDEFSPSESHLSRQYFERRLEQEISRSRRHALPLCVITISSDPTAGEVLLTAELVGLVARSLREEDIAGRLGRRVYAVYLPHTTPAGAAVVIERLVAALQGKGLDIGLAYLKAGTSATPRQLLRTALAGRTRLAA